ncbi:MAG: tetratricopeptide repeat protein [Cyanobacteria bacterium P01_C01_bin.89]
MAEPPNTTNQNHSGSGDNVAGDVVRNQKQQGIIANDQATINVEKAELNFAAPPETAERTGRINNLGRLGIEDPSRFVGRDGELRQLDEKLGAASVVAIAGVVGMGGVGKSELAVQFARQLGSADKFPGGVVWLSGARLLADLIAVAESWFLTKADRVSLDQVESEVGKAQFCWARWPAGAVLVVVDDVVEFRSSVEPLLPGGESFRVLLTTRDRRLLPESCCLFLDVLTREKGLELLGTWIGAERLERELDIAGELVERLGRLPLAIELVGAYLARKLDLSLAAMGARLDGKGLEARALTTVPSMVRAERGVAAAFELSWEVLSAGAQRLAVLLGCFGLATVPWGLVEQCLLEEDGEELEEWRDEELLPLNLLERQGEGLYRLHPLIWEFFGEKRAHQQDGDALQQGFLNTLVSVAKTVPHPPTLSDQDRTRAAVPHLEHATQFTDQIATENEDYVWPFIALARLAQSQSLWQKAVQHLQNALETTETRQGDNHPHTAQSLNNLAALYQSQGRYSDAEPLYRRSLEIKEHQLGDNHPSTATSLNNLALLYKSQGRYSDAEPLFRRSLEIREQQLGDNHPHTATSLNNLAVFYYGQDRLGDSEKYMARALSIYLENLGQDHPHTQESIRDLTSIITAAVNQERAADLSGHPLTQAIIQQLQNQNPQP